MGTRGRTGLVGALVSGVLCLAFAPAAGAVVYCVPDDGIHPSCTPNEDHTTVQAALSAANGTTTVADTVRIGPGIFDEDNLIYSTTDAANTVDVIGAGAGSTTLTRTDTMGFDSVLNFQAPAPSTVSDLRVLIPANDPTNTDSGIFVVLDPTIRRVTVEGGTSNLRGVDVNGDVTLDELTVSLPSFSGTVAGIKVNSASPTITDSVVTAGTVAEHGGIGETTTFERSTLEPGLLGVDADSGSIVIRNSIIDLGSNDAIAVSPSNFNNFFGTISATIEGTTIVGGGLDSIGIRAVADSNNAMGPEISTVTLRSSIVSGPATPVYVAADQDDVATVTTDYSNYPTVLPANVDNDLDNDNTDFGTATLTETNHTTFAPGLDGNHHLLATSPLIDIGDPTAPAPGILDVDGNARSLDGPDADCTARRDIGADEFVQAGAQDCLAPGTFVSGKKKVKSRKKKARVTFTLVSTEPGATFECSLDGGPFFPCASPYVTKLRRGKHTLTSRSKDSSGNLDTSPASFTVKVVKKKPKK